MQLLRKIVVAAIVAGSLPAWAADVAVLRNGFELRHERREAAGEKTRLYLTSAPGSGYVEVTTAEIVRIEAEEYVAPPPKPAGGQQVSSEAAANWRALAQRAGEEHGVDADFVAAVVRAESSGNPRARSRKGAQGLMQLMPATAAQLGVKDAYDPEENVRAGTRHLRELLEKYDGDAVKALAAYNAGAQRVAQYGGVPPYRETQQYVRKIIREYNAKKRAEQAAKKKAARKTVAASATAGAPGGQ